MSKTAEEYALQAVRAFGFKDNDKTVNMLCVLFQAALEQGRQIALDAPAPSFNSTVAEFKEMALKHLTDDSDIGKHLALIDKAIEYGRSLPIQLTDDKPEEEGWYWYQFIPEDKPEMVYVESDLYFGGEGKILIAYVKNAPGRWSHQILPPEGE